jgi:V8-like Glu-specific endopeptidase
MIQRTKVVALLGILVLGACRGQPPGQTHPRSERLVWGADDRTDYGAITDPAVRAWADATAAISTAARLTCDTTTCALNPIPFAQTLALQDPDIPTQVQMPVCPSDPFYHQPTAAMATGFWVGGDLLLTAAHVLDPDPNVGGTTCAQFRAVFGFTADAGGQNAHVNVPATDVYGCSRVVAQVMLDDGSGHTDWAIVKLDRPVSGNRTPLSLRQSGVPAAGTPTTMIGFPDGVPLKVAPNGVIRSIAAGRPQFLTDNDEFAGNSGSPVINSGTGVVEGILTTGSRWAYLATSDGNGGRCATFIQCTSTTGTCSFPLDGVQTILPVAAAMHCGDRLVDGDETDVDCGGPTCTACSVGAHCAATADCTGDGVVCAAGTCQLHCSDQASDLGETGIDCGGTCAAKCPLGGGCASNADCANNLCVSGICAALCADGMKNGDESDVDCGGSCGPCANGKVCLAGGDCQSQRCVHGRCYAPTTCFDGVRELGEVDVDCGGICGLCPDNSSCQYANQCASGACLLGRCMALCNDRVKNGAETDVDCGGGSCAGCAAGLACRVGTDCATGVCADGRCVASTCANGVRDPGTETDLDCGAACGKCGLGAHCNRATDCASGACLLGRCMALCNDQVKNGAETDVDCGGGSCAGCAAGLACQVGTDCASGACADGRCVASTCANGVRDPGTETDLDCGAACGKCGLGARCITGADCASGACLLGRCMALCNDGVKNGAETDVDCGGTCGGCDLGLFCSAGTDCASGTCGGGVCRVPRS